MMRKLTFLVLILAAFSLQSCLNIIEKISLNRDGTGTYAVTYDMSSMMSGMMREMMLESLKEEEDGPFANAMVDGKIELDTIMSVKDAPMTAEGMQGDVPPIMQKVNIKMQVSETQNLFVTTMVLDFDKLSEIAEFNAAIAEAGESGDGPGLGGMMPMAGMFELNGSTLVRKPNKIDPSEMEGENAEMMKMMMAGATYKTVYEFPKKVKSFDIDGAEKTNKKTITATYDLLEIMEGNVDMSGKIKFK